MFQQKMSVQGRTLIVGRERQLSVGEDVLM